MGSPGLSGISRAGPPPPSAPRMDGLGLRFGGGLSSPKRAKPFTASRDRQPSPSAWQPSARPTGAPPSYPPPPPLPRLLSRITIRPASLRAAFPSSLNLSPRPSSPLTKLHSSVKCRPAFLAASRRAPIQRLGAVSLEGVARLPGLLRLRALAAALLRRA